MKMVKKMIDSVYTSTLLLVITVQNAIAQNVSAPPWVKKADADDLNDAGEELNIWIFAFMVVVIALFSIKPGYLFIVGKNDEAIEASKNILVGAVISIVLGGIVFAVMQKVA